MTDDENTTTEQTKKSRSQQSRPENGPPRDESEESLLRGTIPRRAAIGGILAAGGFVAWQSLGDNADPNPGEESPDTDEESTVSPWRYEREVREKYQSQQTSLVPSFDYDQVDIKSERADGSVTRIAATPAASRNGDQLLFVVEDGFGQQLRESLTGFFTAGMEPSQQRQTMIGGSEITFDVHAGEIITIATGAQRTDSGEEVYIVRGETADIIKPLIDEYDEQAMEWKV